MSLLEILYEFIFRYSGINKEKIVNAETEAIKGMQIEREKYNELVKKNPSIQETPNSPTAWYFKYEKNPFLITGLLFVYSLFNQGFTWSESDKVTNGDGKDV